MTATAPMVTYTALVGGVLQQQREARQMKQGDVARLMGLSQPAYSRLESGATTISVTQLRDICRVLAVEPSHVLRTVERYESNLQMQGVKVVTEKTVNAAAIALGIGFLAALLLSTRAAS